MTTPLGVGLALALAATVALETGFVLQHAGASGLPELSLRRVRSSARSLVGARRWLAGFVIGLVGWGLYLGAQRLAPLSLVQAVAAGGIAVLVAIVAAAHRTRPTRSEAVGALVATAGLAALAVSLRHTTAGHLAPAAPPVAICAVLAALAGAAGLAARRGTAAAGGLAAGLLYGAGDISSKLLVTARPIGIGAVAGSGWLYVTLAAHAAGFLALQRSFQRGGAVSSIGPMTAAVNLVPIVAGVALLGDPLPRSSPLLGLRIVAFAATVAGAWMLGRARAAESAEPAAAPPVVEPPARRGAGLPGRRAIAALLGATLLLGLRGTYQYAQGYYEYRGFGPPVDHAPPSQQGSVVDLIVRSPAINRWPADVRVYLPAAYRYQPTRRFPTVYLLQGMPGTSRTAFENALHVVPVMDAGIASGRFQPMIVVMPPGTRHGFAGATEWANGPRPGSAWETYLVRDVVAAVDHTFRTIPTRAARGIAGYSAGGDAAVNAIVLHPDAFGVAEGWSADLRQSPGLVGDVAALVRRYSAIETVGAAAPRMHALGAQLFLYIGKHDRAAPTDRRFVAILRRAHVPVRFEVLSGGHNWRLWHDQLNRSLDFFSGHLR
jgi:S-formylglutathione hydrolase FrmB